jgi:hypothetical protein
MEEVKTELVQDGYEQPANVVKYWGLTVLSFEILSKARLEWVEQSIAILENSAVNDD